MRLATLLAAILTMNASAMADAIRITSPDHAQTFAYGEMIWHQLYLDAAGELAARITFSNLPYVGDDEPRSDEPFDFRFPGVRFDSARRTFVARGAGVDRSPLRGFGKVLRPGGLIWLGVPRSIW
jgi:hypothetical protein